MADVLAEVREIQGPGARLTPQVVDALFEQSRNLSPEELEALAARWSPDILSTATHPLTDGELNG